LRLAVCLTADLLHGIGSLDPALDQETDRLDLGLDLILDQLQNLDPGQDQHPDQDRDLSLVLNTDQGRDQKTYPETGQEATLPEEAEVTVILHSQTLGQALLGQTNHRFLQ